MNRKTKKKGFTLIELLVVIAIIGILAAFLIPAVTGALLNAKITQMLSNGKNIYISVFEADAEDTFGSSVGFPKTGDFTSTHKYFVAVITNEMMNVPYSFFSGPGLQAHNSTNDSGFTGDNCAWRVAENVGTGRDGAPFLVSRNLTRADIPGVVGGAATGTDLSGNLGETAGGAAAAAALKFDLETLVVIQKGGAGLKVDKKDLKNSALINSTEITYTLLTP